MKNIRRALSKKKLLAPFSKRADAGTVWAVGDDAKEEVGVGGGRSPSDSERTLAEADCSSRSGDGGEGAEDSTPVPTPPPPPSPGAPSEDRNRDGSSSAAPAAHLAAPAAPADPADPDAAPAAAPAAPADPSPADAAADAAPARTLRRCKTNPEAFLPPGEFDVDDDDDGEDGCPRRRARRIRRMKVAAEALQRRASDLERRASLLEGSGTPPDDRDGRREGASSRAATEKEKKRRRSHDGAEKVLRRAFRGSWGRTGGSGVEKAPPRERGDDGRDGADATAFDRRREVDLPRREGGGEEGRRRHRSRRRRRKPSRPRSSSGKRNDEEPGRDGKGREGKGTGRSEGTTHGTGGGGVDERRRRGEGTRRGDGGAESEERSRSGSGRSASGSSREGRRRTWKRHLFALGQQARPCHMDASRSEEALIKIARLREGDGAWVRRTGGGGDGGDKDGNVWTYAILKKRREDTMAFVVNERGCSKECPVESWAKFVRVVAPEYALEEEEEDRGKALDAMFVGMGGAEPGRHEDPSSVGRGPALRPGRETGRHVGSSNRGKGLALDPAFVGKGKEEVGESEDLSGEAKVEARDEETGGRIESSSGHVESSIAHTEPSKRRTESSTREEKQVLVPDNNVSLYTLYSEGDAPPAVVLQDLKSSMCVLVSDEGDGEDVSSLNDLDDHNIHVADHDDNISMYTFRHGMRAAAADENKNRNATPPPAEVDVLNVDATFCGGVKAAAGDKNKHRVATPPQAEVYVPNVEAKADCNETPPPTEAVPKKSSARSKQEARRPLKPTPLASISESYGEGGGDPRDGARRRRPEVLPAVDSSGRGLCAANCPDDGDPSGTVSVNGLPSTPAVGRGRGESARRPRGKSREAASDRFASNVGDKAGKRRASRRLSKPPHTAGAAPNHSASNVSDKVEKKLAVQPLSKSLPPAKSLMSTSESPKEETGVRAESPRKGRPEELPFLRVTGRSDGDSGNAKKPRAVQRVHDDPTHAGGPVITKKKKHAVRKSSKSPLAATYPMPIPKSPEEETGARTESPRKGRPEELPPPTVTVRSNGEAVKAKKARSAQQGCDVHRSAGGLADTKKNRKKPSRRATGVPQLSKSPPPTKRVTISESCIDETRMGSDSSRKKPTNETTQAMETATTKNEADFTRSINSIFGPYLGKEHAEHKPARHADDANKEINDTSLKTSKVSTTMEDRNVSMYTLDGGDAALLSSADSTILLLEYVSKQGPDVLAYVPCGSVVLTEKDGTRTFPAAAERGRKVEIDHETLRGLYKSLRNLVGHSSHSGNGEDDRTLRDGTASRHTLDYGDSLMLSSASTTILLVESISERGRDILAYAPCGAVVATKKNRDVTLQAASGRSDAHSSQVEMKRAAELLSASLDHIMPPTFDLEEEASMGQGSMTKKLAKELATSNCFTPKLSTSLPSTPLASISGSSSEDETGAPHNDSEIPSRALPIKPSYSSNSASRLIEKYQSIGEHQRPSHDDEGETNTLNDNSERSRNNRADCIADFRQRRNSIRSEHKDELPSRGIHRQVSWTGDLEHIARRWLRTNL